MSEVDTATPSEAVAPDQQVSYESNGRIITGIGTSESNLADVMERYEPQEAHATETPATPEKPAAATPEPAQPPSRGRQRFADLTAKAKAAEERAATLERELTEWKSKASSVPVPSSPPAPLSSSVPNEGDSGRATRAQPTEEEIGTKYKSYADFVVDSARWVAEQQQSDIDARVRQAIEADRAQQGFQSQVNSVFDRGRHAYPDFDAVRASGPGATISIAPNPQEYQIRSQAILSHPAAEHLIYVISQDAALAHRLGQLDSIAFGMELARLAPSSAGASPASPAVSNVVAPVPYQPVGAASKTSTPALAELAKKASEDFDSSGYSQRRRKELANWGRRR